MQGFDIVVFPLAFIGDRAALYRGPPAPVVFVHDCIWRRRGASAIVTDYSLGFLGLRDGQWKLVHEWESGRSRLYDLEADPQEQRDVAVLYPERTAAYREHLLHWAAAQKYRITKIR